MLQAGYAPGSTWFLTLTMPAAVDADASFDLIGTAFKRFRQRVQRAFGHHEWAAVLEAQPLRGVAHLHVLMRGPVMGKRWLARAASASGFGQAADVRPARAGHSRYMVKTLRIGATVRLPAYTRRVRLSRSWAACLPRLKVPRGTQWWIANAPPEQTAEFLRSLGYVVTEMVAGWPSRRPRCLPVRWWPAGALGFGRRSVRCPSRAAA